MPTASYIVLESSAGTWSIIATVESVNADAAINQARTGPGTFVAVLARGFRPRTHYAPPREAAKPTNPRETQN